MALEYNLDGKLKTLAPVLKEHVAWFDAVMRRSFYWEGAKDQGASMPKSFLLWLEEAREEELLDAGSLNDLKTTHDNLHAAGDAFIAAASAGAKPDPALFDKLVSLYEDFMAQIGEQERKCLLEDIGIDALTGLRSKRALLKDLKKELERFARNGKQFTVAIARIDEYQKILDTFGADKTKEYVVLVAGLIKKSMRAFDDAYVFADDKFILCLKQSEVRGGLAALERLRHELEEENVIINLGDSKMPLTMSCCVAEPQPDEKVDELLQNLDDDLKSTRHESDTVLKYYEMSALERYVQAAEE